MKTPFNRKAVIGLLAACGIAAAMVGPAWSEQTDLSNVPLANSPSDAVLPNLMYILDDSGSMMWDYMPDNIHTLSSGVTINNCKDTSGTVAGAQCSNATLSPAPGPSTFGEPPYYSPQFNQIYYNPNISYTPGVDSKGVSMGNATPTAAWNDAYLDTATADQVDLTTGYPEIYYCTTSSPTTAQLSDTTVCRRNGINNLTSGSFLYWSNSTTNGGYPTGSTFTRRVIKNTGHPYYFTITANEFCSDANLVNCQLATSASGIFTIPAPIRYCGTSANAASTSAVSDAANSTSPKCRKKFDVSNFKFPRYGQFTRTDIVPATTQYTKGASAVRPDCAAATFCTYQEELQNFANWYSYYRVRITMMKTATGHAFIPIDDRYRVGFITINPGSPVDATGKYVPLATFDSTQKSTWYSYLYKQTNNGGTPLRTALARVGRHYAGVTSGINSGMPEDPMTFSCQQNFSLLTTDGYWNDTTNPPDIAGNAVGNRDAVEDTVVPKFVSRASGTLDGEGTVVTSVTPTTTIEQTICTGTNSTNFTGTQETGCGCSSGQRRIKQRTLVTPSTATTTDGVSNGAPSNGTTTATFQDISGCTLPLIVTTTRPVTETAQNVCSKNNNTAFASAANGASGQTGCGCGSGQTALWQRVVTYNQTVTTTDGVVTTTTNSATTSGPTFSLLTACSSASKTAAATVVTQGTITSQTNNSGSGGQTLTITLAPNPQSTIGTTTSTTTPGGTANTLADVAMYYYKTDLRTAGTKSDNNVPTTDKDFTNQQHMTTFTLGLGLQGNMDYQSDYETNSTSDFGKIKAAASGCAFSGSGTCNWPAPSANTPSTLDDLWHAAVNGRGIYYSASDPNSLADGLSNALSALKIQTAAASASATSSPNITETDNFIYSTTFRTVKWDGEVQARRIDAATGQVIDTIVWSAQQLLDNRVSSTTDNRSIWMFSGGAATKLKSFLYASMDSTETVYFDKQCSDLSQCNNGSLSAPQVVLANDGNNLVNYLRGQNGFSIGATAVYRQRDHVLGDSVNATPAFVRAPGFGFTDQVTPDYSSFKTANATRQGVLYVAANDGMLHALNGDTGVEMWAYVPHQVLPTMHLLATDSWDVQHKYLVDGSPASMDVFDSTAAAWKTILVAGLNKGGTGYYALDITDPNNPKGLWEACNDPNLCAITDPDMGFSYGNPVITKRASDKRWVVIVTSGMNNVPDPTNPAFAAATGRGFLYVLDALTGKILQKVDTGDGDTKTPSGLSKISAFADSFNTDNTALYVYGGDLKGNLWRFDMRSDPPVVLRMATLMDAKGNPQSITSRPELGLVKTFRVVFVGTGRYLGATDLSDPATLTPPLTWAYQQSAYAIKDKDVAYGNPRTSSPGLVQQFLTDNGTTRTVSNNPVDWTKQDGWFVDFNPGNTSPGERVNLDPQLILGTLVVVTNIPNNTACTVGGDSFVYQFAYDSGAAVGSSPGGVVGSKTTGQITVGVVVVRTTSGTFVGEKSGALGTPPTGFGINIGGSGGGGRRISWRELLQ